ncbi:dual specificity protein phosphatase family protein [Amylibacter sp.]|nr:dual specificity protein phosphatase family protein [Amylibacter sp.]
MTKEPFKIFTYNEYTLGEIGICREPHTIAEFNNVKEWDADVIVTMTQVEEFGIDNFKKKISDCCIRWLHLPVDDFDIPSENISLIIEELLNLLNSNKRILIHCKGGQGRSGMLAMRLLVEQGLDPNKALKKIRKIRPYAIETKQQENWASKKYCNKSNQS